MPFIQLNQQFAFAIEQLDLRSLNLAVIVDAGNDTTPDRKSQAACDRRFFAISAGGFAVNESAYALLLHWTTLRYDLLLAAVLVGVAGLTYVLSRHWAFLRTS